MYTFQNILLLFHTYFCCRQWVTPPPLIADMSANNKAYWCLLSWCFYRLANAKNGTLVHQAEFLQSNGQIRIPRYLQRLAQCDNPAKFWDINMLYLIIRNVIQIIFALYLMKSMSNNCFSFAWKRILYNYPWTQNTLTYTLDVRKKIFKSSQMPRIPFEAYSRVPSLFNTL